MIERERAIWEAAEVTTAGTDEVGAIAPQRHVPSAVSNDDEARRARFREALDRVMTKHHNVLAALAK